MAMKFIVTGGMGFVGSHLCDQLIREKHDITILSRSDVKMKSVEQLKKHIDIEKIDITDSDKLKKIIKKIKPDCIVHLAGETSHSKSFENTIHDVDSNAKSTLVILETIKKFNPTCKFVLGSTFIVIGRPTSLPVNETTPCNPTTIYGANRLASEYYCKIYNQVYGLDTRVFRITNSFGPREQIVANKNAINFLIYKAFKGEDITIFNHGEFFRDLIYISDVISGLNAILKNGKAGNLYWISSGKKTWFYQLGKWLEELTDAKIKYVKTPTYTKKVDVGNFVVDNRKLMSLGWKTNTSVKEGIQKTLDYFRECEIN
jgi:nucleoside-diphosphate-sugar epimerase